MPRCCLQSRIRERARAKDGARLICLSVSSPRLLFRIHTQAEEKDYLFFAADVKMGSSKIQPHTPLPASSPPLCLTSPFQCSSALLQLPWPRLVTAHLCQGAIRYRWRAPRCKTSQSGGMGRCYTNARLLFKPTSTMHVACIKKKKSPWTYCRHV